MRIEKSISSQLQAIKHIQQIFAFKTNVIMFRVPQQENNEVQLNTLENHSTDLNLDLAVFRDNSTSAITIQPQVGGDSQNAGTRRPIPVSTIDWQTTPVSQFIPMNGLDFLSGAEQLYIQQTVELNDLLANVDSENRYTIKVPQGETLYYASESSTNCQRMCFGSSRSYVLKLYDQSQQEAMEFRRRLACGACSFWCYLQAMEVWTPPGELTGVVEQQMNLSVPLFIVYNKHRDIIYRVEGPSSCGCISFGKDAHFKIYSADGMTQVGSINHQWDQIQVAYNLCIQFPGRSVDTRHKALLLGTAFLLEYMYFENSKTSNCRCVC